MKKRPFTASFDELMKNHYGSGRGEHRRDISRSAEKLYARYYGDTSALCEKKRKKGKQATALSLSYDDGETLNQQPGGEQFEEYVVQQSVADDGFEEYVVESASGAEGSAAGQSHYSTQSSTGGRFDAIPAEEGNPAQECEVDIFPPPKKSHIPVARVSADRTPPEPQQRPEDGGLSALKEFAASQSGNSDDDFMADIQAILSGDKVYDKDTQQVRGKQSPPQSQQQSVGRSSGNDGPPLPEARNEHDIFNRIAQSMQYANAYDLGTVELENRFADFDRTAEQEQRAAREKKARPRVKGTPSPSATPAAPPALEIPVVDSADFLQDLDAIREKAAGDAAAAARDAAAAAAEVKVPTALSMSLGQVSRLGTPDSGCMPLALSLSQFSDPADYARPLFDTGEHVRAGWDLYTDQLRVGKNPGVLFSYGELISMGDFYQSASHMIGADVAELQGLKRLIQQSTNHYTGKGAADVKDDDWEKITKFRYLELAEDNFHHFSPDYLFAGTVWGKAAVWKPNNKRTWEEHHRWAIEEAQKMFLDPANANTSFFPEWPLIINAFGDHFLTDAFAAGHLVNKEAIIEYYKYNFNDGNALKPEAKKFFDRVAEKAWYGDVKSKFSDLETYDGVVLGIGHPNIDDADRFASVLKGVAEQRPDQIGNLAVKALHDKLNKDGVEVVNDAGDGPWTLYGDGMLNDANLKIIQKAVQQSVDNVNDPTVYGSNLDFPKYYAKVWRFVPKMTAASQARVKQLAKVYTSPDSADLVQAAADLIHKKVDILIKKLRDAKKLRPR